MYIWKIESKANDSIIQSSSRGYSRKNKNEDMGDGSVRFKGWGISKIPPAMLVISIGVTIWSIIVSALQVVSLLSSHKNVLVDYSLILCIDSQLQLISLIMWICVCVWLCTRQNFMYHAKGLWLWVAVPLSVFEWLCHFQTYKITWRAAPGSSQRPCDKISSVTSEKYHAKRNENVDEN